MSAPEPATVDGMSGSRFGAQVTKRVGCGWIASWRQARQTGDKAGVKRAQDAMKSSHQWKVVPVVLDDHRRHGRRPPGQWF